VIAGQMPPPIQGFSYVNQQMAALLSAQFDTVVIDLSPRRTKRDPGYHLLRLWLAVKGTWVVLSGRRGGERCFYIGCEGGLGIAYTVLLAGVARLCGYRVFIHHHSYAYIDAWRPLMALLLATTGGRGTHIFLCATMEAAFRRRYRGAYRSLVLSNSAFVAPVDSPATNARRPLTIGLLSNLDDTKGLGDFLALVAEIPRRGLDIDAILAGPPQSAAARAAIDRALAASGARLDYRGAVYGAAKDAFFEDIDVFVFPTRYANEAQPLVIFEAQARGIPVIAYDRGCIRAQIGADGAVVAPDHAFVPFALSWLEQYSADPAAAARGRLTARDAYAEQSRQAREQAGRIFDLLATGSLAGATSEAPARWRVDIWHNILWSKYKGEVFSAIDEIADKQEFEIRFIQIAETDADRVGLSGIDLSYHRYPYTLLFRGALAHVPATRRVFTLFRRALTTDADLILLAGYERIDYWIQLLALKLRRKRVTVFCDSTIFDRQQAFSKGILKSLFFRVVDAIFCYGTRSMEYVAYYGADPAKIFKRCQAAAIPHDYSVARALVDRLAAAAPATAPRYLYVGRLSPEKDIETLFDAFARIAAGLPEARLVLVGAGPSESALRAAAVRLRIDHAVTFAGSRSGTDLFQEYSRASCLILPSRSEPWGLVVNEALSFGCPVIVSRNCGCVPELVVEGKTGFSYQTGSVAELAERMIAVTTRFADIDATARACIDQIKEFSPQAAAEQIIFGLRTTLARRGPSLS
jgi:glycosyltransferase involved in cell wall biosynthesis